MSKVVFTCIEKYIEDEHYDGKGLETKKGYSNLSSLLKKHKLISEAVISPYDVVAYQPNQVGQKQTTRHLLEAVLQQH